MATYTPIKASGSRSNYRTSTMPKKGMNLEDYSQMMNTDYALNIVNYIPQRYGLLKRAGLRNIFERAGAVPITLLKKFTDDIWIFGYGTKVEAWNEAADTFTTIKSNFTSGVFDGTRYGEYFFVCNGIEKIWRIDNALAISEVSASPVSTGIKVIGSRLFSWFEDTITYSEVDDGSNPPFDSWSQTTAADTAGAVNYRNAGTIRSVVQLSGMTVAFGDSGFFAFKIETIDSAGTLKKVEIVQNYTEDYGGARGAIETPIGIFYLNEAGLWHMLSVGDTTVPMNKQETLTSTLLSSEYFDGTDQTSSDLIYDLNQKCVFVTLAKDSAFNNLVIGCKPELNNAMFTFNNWNINRFAKDGQDIYGASSVKTTVYRLFDGYEDDGLEIGTEYYQEIPLGTFFHAHSLDGIYAGGFLTSGDELLIRFDTFDLTGLIQYDKEKYRWTGESGNSDWDEWGSAQFGGSAWGGSFVTAGLVSSFSGGSPRVNNLQRLRIRITGSSTTKHILNWISAKTTQKQPIRRRNLTRITS